MTTSVIITGTGTPLYVPHRAGAGALVLYGDTAQQYDTALQFDTGQATRLRMSEAGFDISALSAIYFTHHHSDHMLGLADVLTTRWMETYKDEVPPLPIVAPDGVAADIAAGVMDVWAPEVAMRMEHVEYPNRPEPEVIRFTPTDTVDVVDTRGPVTVKSALVDHPPVVPAVGYRVETPDGIVAVSGDTRVCPGLEALCEDADIAVCEVIRLEGLVGLLSKPEKIAAYHAEVGELGAMAERARVKHLVLTHLIPAPPNWIAESMFTRGMSAHYQGELVVGRDAMQITLESRP